MSDLDRIEKETKERRRMYRSSGGPRVAKAELAVDELIAMVKAHEMSLDVYEKVRKGLIEQCDEARALADQAEPVVRKAQTHGACEPKCEMHGWLEAYDKRSWK